MRHTLHYAAPALLVFVALALAGYDWAIVPAMTAGVAFIAAGVARRLTRGRR